MAKLTFAALATLLVAGVLLTLLTQSSLASMWRLVYVTQPLEREGMIEICDVPFGSDTFLIGGEVELTSTRNAIRMIGEEFDEHTQNLNLASRSGLLVLIDPYLESLSNTRPDTLVVKLDASRIDKLVDKYVSADTVVAATIMCVRINAARSGADYVSIRIQGPRRLQSMGGLFAVADQPQRRVFTLMPVN
jgi:hypothetical protein